MATSACATRDSLWMMEEADGGVPCDGPSAMDQLEDVVLGAASHRDDLVRVLSPRSWRCLRLDDGGTL